MAAPHVAPEQVAAHHLDRPTKPRPNATAAAATKVPVAIRPPGPIDEALPAPPPPRPPDLDAAMRLATGSTKPHDPAPATSEPESSARQVRPAQGAIVAALRSVQERARACLDADDPPRVVSVTFVASGVVAAVETSTRDAKGTCIVDALKVAKVEPFAETSFRARVTIRAK